jgi:hypothetical protein
MTVHEGIARRCIAARWESDFTFGVAQTALRRPGRGRSKHVSNKRGWRYETRIGELEKFSAFVGELVGRLELGTLTMTRAIRGLPERRPRLIRDRRRESGELGKSRETDRCKRASVYSKIKR